MQLTKLVSKPTRLGLSLIFLVSLVMGAMNISAVSAADSCGYTFTGAGYANFGGTTFNESTVLKAISLQTTPGTGLTVAAWYSDEHAITLGARRVVTGVTPVDYPVGPPSSAGPGVHLADPATGATVAQGGMDAAGRPMGPSLFITKVANANVNANVPQPGDWQSDKVTKSKTNPAATGAKQDGTSPDDIYGSWLSGVMTRNADGTYKSYDNDPDPHAKPATKGQWSALNTNDTPPPNNASTVTAPTGSSIETFVILANKPEEYVAEARWTVSNLKAYNPATDAYEDVTAGNSYKVQMLVNDGDNAGDKGEGCAIVTIPQASITTHPSPGIEHVQLVIGNKLGDVATITGNKGTPTGTVDFDLYGPFSSPAVVTATSCTAGNHLFGPINRNLSTVNSTTASATLATADGYLFDTLGTYVWVGTYKPAAGSPYSSTADDCGDETVQVVDGRIRLNPLDATNTSLTQHHTITATVDTTTDGTTFTPVPNGKTVTFTLLSNSAGAAFDSGNTCTTGTPTSGSGACPITIHATTVGSVNIHAESSFTLTGVIGTFNEKTGDPGNSSDAVKRWIGTKLLVQDQLVGLPTTTNTDGTVVYSVYNNNNCSSANGGLVDSDSKSVTDGLATASKVFDINPGDTRFFQATYTGTVNGTQTSFTSACNETASSGQ